MINNHRSIKNEKISKYSFYFYYDNIVCSITKRKYYLKSGNPLSGVFTSRDSEAEILFKIRPFLQNQIFHM
jgi:hypothetical protein